MIYKLELNQTVGIAPLVGDVHISRPIADH